MVVRSGYVDVKLPAGARSCATWKGWRRKWLDLSQIQSSSDSGPEVLLQVRSHRDSPVLARGTLGQSAQVFRSASKSRSHAVAVRCDVTDDAAPLVFLAGPDETTSQEWMAALRALLWPPAPMVELEKALGFHKFEVSLVDDSYTSRAGLLGSYGSLSIGDRKLTLTHPHTEHVIQEWYLNTLVSFTVLRGQNSADHGKLLAIECGSTSSTGKGVLHLFCPEAILFVDTMRSIVANVQTRTKPGTRQEDHKDAPRTSSALDVQDFRGRSEPIPCPRQSHISTCTDDSGVSLSSSATNCGVLLDSEMSEVALGTS